MITEDLQSLGLDLKHVDQDFMEHLGEKQVFVTREEETSHLLVSFQRNFISPALNPITPDLFNPLQGSHLCDYSPNTIDDDCKNKSKAYGIVKTWESMKDIQKDKASAEDLNNVGCAYIWWNESWKKAVEMFEKAKNKTQDSDMQAIIEGNLNNAHEAVDSKPIQIHVPVRSFEPLKRVLGTLDQRNVTMDASIRTELGLEKP
jgi:hypothetical protein